MTLLDTATSMLLDEYFDLQETMDELERRRETLRAAIERELRSIPRARLDHPRGTARMQRWQTLDVAKVSPILGALVDRDWVDSVLRVNPRRLHKLAASDEGAMRALAGHVRLRGHTALYVTRRRA